MLLQGEMGGCVQLDETYGVNSDEGTSTVIFLDGIYQNCAISANAKTGTVERCKLKDGIGNYPRTLTVDDVEFGADTDKIVTETVHGNVIILCCSLPILKFIKNLAMKHENNS
jgi:hypothetical protein